MVPPPRSVTPSSIAAALSDSDPAMAAIIQMVGPPPRRRAIPVAQRFEQLATAILHQQLAGAAAATITSRVVVLLGGSLTAEGILSAPEGALRTCGVSEAKRRALLDLAGRVSDGSLDLKALGRHDDEQVVAILSEVRGVGRWTAEMFLMGPLARHDVWPVGDLGVRNGWGLIQGLPSTPSPKALSEAADELRPFRSSVAWYCWQAVDVARGNGGVLPR